MMCVFLFKLNPVYFSFFFVYIFITEINSYVLDDFILINNSCKRLLVELLIVEVIGIEELTILLCCIDVILNLL